MSALNATAPTAPSAVIVSAPSPAPSWWGPGLTLNFNVKTTLIYIGGSLGVLGVIMCFLMLTMILWVRPSRRRRLELLNRERHRLETLREVKVEPDNFTPQVRAFPVVVLQPDDSEVACGRKVSLDTESQPYHQRELGPEPSQPLDIETGDCAAGSSSISDRPEEEASPAERQGSGESREEQIAYNPLTHYLTDASTLPPLH